MKSYKEMITEQIDICRSAMNIGNTNLFANALLNLFNLLKPKLSEELRKRGELLMSDISRMDLLPYLVKRHKRSEMVEFYAGLVEYCIEQSLLVEDPDRDVLKGLG